MRGTPPSSRISLTLFPSALPPYLSLSLSLSLSVPVRTCVCARAFDSTTDRVRASVLFLVPEGGVLLAAASYKWSAVRVATVLRQFLRGGSLGFCFSRAATRNRFETRDPRARKERSLVNFGFTVWFHDPLGSSKSRVDVGLERPGVCAMNDDTGRRVALPRVANRLVSGTTPIHRAVMTFLVDHRRTRCC